MISIRALLIGLIIFIAFCIFVVVGIYLIITLRNLNNLAKRANKVFEKNDENINTALATLPIAVKNLNEVAISIKASSDKAGTVIDTIDDVITETVVTVSESTEGIFDFLKTAGNIASIITGFFSSFKH